MADKKEKTGMNGSVKFDINMDNKVYSFDSTFPEDKTTETPLLISISDKKDEINILSVKVADSNNFSVSGGIEHVFGSEDGFGISNLIISIGKGSLSEQSAFEQNTIDKPVAEEPAADKPVA
ncbi:hypothetical protein N9E78_00795, partial [bacterium]|nr:hypothetical protein [bacterium]